MEENTLARLGQLLSGVLQPPAPAPASQFLDPQMRPEMPPDTLALVMEALKGALGIGGQQPIGSNLDRAQAAGEMVSMAGVPIAAAKRALGAAKAPIKAYHGSPHDFDQFSLDKIGTGEGAQAYGHGLYFAESEDVARGYRDRLKDAHTDYKRTLLFNGEPITPEHSDYMTVDRIASRGADDVIAAQEKSYLDKLAKLGPDNTLTQASKRALDKMQRFRGTKAESITEVKEPPAKMYEVNIHADPEDFLDWDAPLSPKQSEAAYKSLGDVRPVKQANGYYGVTMVGPDGSGKMIQGINEQTPEAAMAASRQWMDNIRGNDAYSVLSGIKGDRVKAAEDLRKAGIPGIKYLDGASRSAGQGSRNYVVFDDKLVEIVKKYGIAAAVSAGLLSESQARQMQEQGYQ